MANILRKVIENDKGELRKLEKIDKKSRILRRSNGVIVG